MLILLHALVRIDVFRCEMEGGFWWGRVLPGRQLVRQ